MRETMAIFKKILFLSLVALFLLTCKKDDSNLVCSDANTIKPPKDALDYFYFKEGTWWLYQEDSTGLTDSVWVSHSTMNQENLTASKRACNCGHGSCTQHAIVTFSNRAHNANTDKPLNGIGIRSSFTLGLSDISEGSDFCFLGSGFRWWYKNYKAQSPTDQGAILENLDSIVVKGKIFKDIIHHYYPIQTNIPDWLHEAWYARNIYLVKYRKYDGTNWSLIDYHIVK